ncbi:hypothetical protein AVEN_241259-1 [Araneus ventricosus]|uniref:Uncharacterized protein n=1 Tax=Araneus ventricosus TaxID=182803 RepID=A0A4Y2TZQ7_ARAVE|nr:hypothetical protein AVEN_241259-1 [Araneus ventricosus]
MCFVYFNGIRRGDIGLRSVVHFKGIRHGDMGRGPLTISRASGARTWGGVLSFISTGIRHRLRGRGPVVYSKGIRPEDMGRRSVVQLSTGIRYGGGHGAGSCCSFQGHQTTGYGAGSCCSFQWHDTGHGAGSVVHFKGIRRDYGAAFCRSFQWHQTMGRSCRSFPTASDGT